MVTWILAKKDLRLLLRDRRAVVILLAMPLIFILVLGLSLGEGFGQKPDDRLRVSILDEDQGLDDPALAAAIPFGARTWSEVVRHDLDQTAGIRVEVITTHEQAERAVRDGNRAAVLAFGPKFSRRVAQTSFLADGINPFYRDGVRLEILDAELLKDQTQLTAASIIEQVGQVSLLRVILPWMIGRAFEKLGDPMFMRILKKEAPTLRLLPDATIEVLGAGVQNALKKLFPNYNLTAKTWASLTKSEPREGGGAAPTPYVDPGSGLLKRGALRYQILVPSYTVMFAFFLVLTVGWLFVAERHQGTLKRLRAAPLSRTQILLGKLIPCFALSFFQGLFLLGAGRLVFGMSWGPDPGWLLLVIFTTSLAAMGMALFVAALARTETQVAIYGTLLVLVLAGISGCLMGDRELMPEPMQQISLATPHAWALMAYKQLLTAPAPNLAIVAKACGALSAFGAGFVGLAWSFLKLD
jgi:linearmycin/streptolysin S transport system permease protein